MFVGDVRPDQFIDAVQTVGLVITAVGQVYIIVLLRNEIRRAAAAIAEVRNDYAGFGATIEGLQSRIRALEVLVRNAPGVWGAKG